MDIDKAMRVAAEGLAHLPYASRVAATLAAEVERLTRERDEAKAQKETLMDALTDAMRIVAKADPKGFADWIAAAGKE